MSRRVALLVPGLEIGGGVTTVGEFLYNVLRDAKSYTPDLISLAMGAYDPASTQLTKPSTWIHGAQVEEKTWDGIPYRHVGARWSELEVQRYQPRPPLTELLRSYDLVQIVAGTPPWVHVARHVDVPVALQVATLTEAQRDGQYADEALPLRLWHKGMMRLAARLERHVPSLVDAIFVENARMYDHYREHVDEDALHFAPPGVDIEMYHPGEADGNTGDYILCVGRLGDPRKNVRLLFDAYHRLTEQIANPPRLILAGLSAPTHNDWAYAEDLGVRDAIEMHENVPEEDLADLYRRARLFVLPSNEEGLGLVLAEAMASGTPVVSTDCGGPSTLINDGTTGFLVPVGDADALASRMAHLLRNPDKAAKMGTAGRAHIENRFSVNAAGERFLRVYDNLLGIESVADPLA